jgi:rfaE bifunctional protein nucleotidyltransferase chain/domain/rfaE bifunctional protein kinase chain/domain
VSAPLVVVGDALLDRDVDGTVERLSPDAPVPVLDESSTRSRPGGAALAAVLAAADGREVTLITALADDAPGRELERLLAERGVDVVNLGLAGTTPEKVRVRTGGRSLLRIDRGGGAPGPVGPAGASTRAAIGWASALLVADYGRGVAAEQGIRDALLGASTKLPVVWDPHPRGPAPVRGVTLATPNAGEAAGFAPEASGEGGEVGAAAARAGVLRERWGAEAVCVTLGTRGALLVGAAGEPLAIPAPLVAAGDPCGAGDRFASRCAAALGDGHTPEQAVSLAVASASAFVAAGGAGAGIPAPGTGVGEPATRPSTALETVERVRARGGTVVATGGCFDLLHPGHIGTLAAARALGDCLVVCINSDDSVRRLKGAGRPLVGEADRAEVLRALECVDAVAVFGEDTPESVLDQLRPDIWVKGGDYAAEELPESALLRRWGGTTVIVPYLAGRSTTRLIQEASLHAVG